MKKFGLIASAILMGILFPITASAQDLPIDLGSIYLGGGWSIDMSGGDLYNDSEDNSQKSFTINPFVSYFAISGFRIGGELELTNWSQGDRSSSVFGIGPHVMYYFNIGGATEAKGATFPYLGAKFLYESYKTDIGTNSYTNKWTKFGFVGGAIHMLSDAVGVFSEAAFNIHSYKPDGSDESTSGYTISFFIIGFSYFIY